MRYYGYEEFVKDIKELAKRVGECDAIVAIARGGLTPAHMLAEALDVRDLYTIGSRSYKDQQKVGKPILSQVPKIDAKKVVVVDDIVDSGETMREVMAALSSQNPEVHFVSAALFYKPSACYHPDIWLQKADEWIEFFWTKDVNDTDDRQLR